MAAAATISTMAMLNTTKAFNPFKPTPKPSSSTSNTLISIQNLPKILKVSENNSSNLSSTSVAGTALAGAVFSTLTTCDAAFAAQQIAEIAESTTSGDNRGLALLLPLIPAIAWVLYNILQPALNQINRMRSTKGLIIGLGLSSGIAAAATGFLQPLHASAAAASEIAVLGDAGSSDNRGQLLLIVVTPAILWVLYNILQPALNQINRMRSD